MKSLVRYMERADKTQVDIAKELSTTQSTISKWIRGAGSPRPRQLVQIAKMCRVSIVKLIDELPPNR